ncbi:MAG TPA: hypothetical protein VEG32_12025 [Clostridia bacterium]|nr:hypothetical protein [Clostridia bacterium]
MPAKHTPSFQSNRSSHPEFRRPVAGADAANNVRHPKRMAHGQTFRPGDTVRESGIYEVLHNGSHRAAHEVVMIAADLFPACDTCFDQVRFRLIRTAPYIFSDADFDEPDE